MRRERTMSEPKIDEKEVEHHVEILRRILREPDADARRLLFVEGVSKFGSGSSPP
jgi:hypothetical protein